MSGGGNPDLGDLVVVLLAGTLAQIRDRLTLDGFGEAASLVGDLAEAADHYVSRALAERGPGLAREAFGAGCRGKVIDMPEQQGKAEVYPEGKTISSTECPECGEPVVEERVTCANCGHRYQDSDYEKSTEELVEGLPDEFMSEMSDEELRKKGLDDAGDGA